jgi:hypothetical protein
VEPDKTPDETAEPPARPVSTRPTPGPRGSDTAGSETTRIDTRGRSVERHTAELRGHDKPADHPAGDYQAGDYQGGDYQGGDYQGADYRGGVSPAGPTVPTNIYRARRPAVAVLLIIPAVAVGLLLLRALAISAFGDTFRIEGVIASSCALASLPLLVAGLYGLVTGAAHGAEQFGFKVWARPPLAYLLVGLALVMAAGLAIR